MQYQLNLKTVQYVHFLNVQNQSGLIPTELMITAQDHITERLKQRVMNNNDNGFPQVKSLRKVAERYFPWESP